MIPKSAKNANLKYIFIPFFSNFFSQNPRTTLQNYSPFSQPRGMPPIGKLQSPSQRQRPNTAHPAQRNQHFQVDSNFGDRENPRSRDAGDQIDAEDLARAGLDNEEEYIK